MPLELRTSATDPEVRTRVLDLIFAQADAVGLPFDGDQVQIEAWEDDHWLGGLTGRTHQRWFYVELLGVASEARGQRVGSRLMDEAERLARERNLVGLWLDTYSFQAPGFYARLGFEEVGRIPGYPPGHARIFLAKRLNGRPAQDAP